MRDRDLVEFSAVNNFSNREQAALILGQRYGRRSDVWTVDLDEPICVFGCIEASPNVVSLLFFARPCFSTIALWFTKYVRRELFPRLFSQGVHRIQCHSISHYGETHEWLRTLGLEREGTIPALGKNRESFDTFALVRPRGC